MGTKRKSAVPEMVPSSENMPNIDVKNMRLVDAEAEARWSKLDDQGLKVEVAEYRCVLLCPRLPHLPLS